MKSRESKIPLEEIIYLNIRSAILNQKIKPNMQLNEEQLASSFNVSRTPIRTVLKRLQYERLIQIIPNKGAFIYDPTSKEIEEVFYMREIIETEAVRIACREATEDQLNKLENLTYEEEKLYQKQEYDKVLAVTRNIHLGIVRIAGNEVMLRHCQELTNITDVYLAFYDDISSFPQGPHEHRQIIQAIRERDEKAAVLSLLEHFRNIRRVFLNCEKKEGIPSIGDIFQPIKT